jgi:transposase
VALPGWRVQARVGVVKADRLHPLIPHETDRWKSYYKQRTAVEREFGRLKNEWSLAPLRVRRLPRVTLHVNLTILAQLADALSRADTAAEAA